MDFSRYLNKNILNLKPSAAVAITDKARDLKAQGINIISLAGGDPDFDTPHVISNKAIECINSGLTHYCAGRGILPLRTRIARKLNEENNIKCNEDNILITPGGKLALWQTLFTLLNKGDKVLVPDPGYVSYIPMVTMAGGIAVPVELDFECNYELTSDKLEKAYSAEVKALVINSPCNPTGHVLTEKEIKCIRNFVKKHNILVITDEVYEKIIYDGRKHISLASFEDISDKVITVNSLSKTFAMTGWRVGYICAEKNLLDAIYLTYMHSVTCVSEFSQQASVLAFDCKKEMQNMCTSYQKRRDYLFKQLSLIPSFKCLCPEGAFYLWCKIDYENKNSCELASYILEKANVATVPGDAFSTYTDKCIRFCFAYSQTDLEEAVKRIKNVF